MQWDEAIPGTRRFYTADPWGNRIELVGAAARGGGRGGAVARAPGRVARVRRESGGACGAVAGLQPARGTGWLSRVASRDP